MIIVSENNGTVTSSKNKGQAMTMNVTGNSFKFMLDNLYTQPHRAVVRELSSNAWDSHVSAKNLIPFHIQVPSKFNPIFKIRDYGTGLDKEEINKYLNCLYSSNKDSTNDQIGGFGLGSKSPFALVPSFFISSYKDGIEYKCFWYRDAENIPVLKIQSEKPTEEPNGILYTITFDAKDVDQVYKACVSELLGLPVRPLFFSDLNDETTEIDLLKEENISYGYSCENYFDINIPDNCPSLDCFINHRSRSGYNILISIGGILYPIPNNVNLYPIVKDIEVFHSLTSTCKFIVVNFPIGQLALPSTREHILNTTNNGTLIFTRLKEVLTQYTKDFNTVFQEFYKDTDLTVFKNMLNSVSAYVKYRNIQLNQYTFKLFPYSSTTDLSCKYSDFIAKINNSSLKDEIAVNQDLFNLVNLKLAKKTSPRYPLDIFRIKRVKQDLRTSSSSYDGVDLPRLINSYSSKKVLLVFNSSKKFMGSYLPSVKDFASFTDIFRVNINPDISNVFGSIINVSEMFQILKEHLELHNISDRVILIDDSTLVKPEQTVSTVVIPKADLPISGIRTSSIDSVGGLPFSKCTPIDKKYDEDLKSIPFDKSYLIDEPVIFYIDKSKYKHIHNWRAFAYLKLLNFTTVYCLKSEDYLPQLQKACEDSNKVLIDFNSGTIDYLNFYGKDIDVDLIKEIVTLMYVKTKVNSNLKLATLDRYLKDGKFPLLSNIINEKIKSVFNTCTDHYTYLTCTDNRDLGNYIYYNLEYLFEVLIKFEGSPLESLDYDSLLASVKESTDPLTYEVITHLLNFKHEGK